MTYSLRHSESHEGGTIREDDLIFDPSANNARLNFSIMVVGLTVLNAVVLSQFSYIKEFYKDPYTWVIPVTTGVLLLVLGLPGAVSRRSKSMNFFLFILAVAPYMMVVMTWGLHYFNVTV